MKKYKYSIIIPHINEGYLLDITLDSIYNKFNYKKFEVVVIDDGSYKLSDLDFIKNHPLKKKIKIFFQKDLGSPNARNFGANKSTGDVLIFLDSHMYFTDDFLTKLNKLLSKYEKIDLLQPIIGSIQDKRMEGCIYKIKDNLLYSHWDLPKIEGKDIKFEEINDIIESPNIAGGATIIKRKVFEDLDGFNKHFLKWGCEDLEFSMRAWLRGYNCFFTPNLFVAHYFKQSFTNTTIKIEEVLNNRLMTLYTCFNNKTRSDLILKDLREHYGKELFDKINNEVINNVNFSKWLKKQQKKYIINDDLYFEKFKDYYPHFQKKKIAIVSQYTDNIEHYSKYTIAINNEYAKKNGYDFIVHKGEFDSNNDNKYVTWDKVFITKKYLENYEYIIWLDADTMIMNHDIKIEQFITDKNLIICSDDSNSGKKETVNTGTYIIKNSEYSKKLLDKLEEVGKELDLFNRFPAEQETLVYMYQNNILDLKDNITIFQENSFNSSNPAHLTYIEGQFILHMMSTDNSIREEYFKKYYEQLKSKYSYNLNL